MSHPTQAKGSIVRASSELPLPRGDVVAARVAQDVRKGLLLWHILACFANHDRQLAWSRLAAGNQRTITTGGTTQARGIKRASHS
jgi:hypothetical protein